MKAPTLTPESILAETPPLPPLRPLKDTELLPILAPFGFVISALDRVFQYPADPHFLQVKCSFCGVDRDGKRLIQKLTFEVPYTPDPGRLTKGYKNPKHVALITKDHDWVRKLGVWLKGTGRNHRIAARKQRMEIEANAQAEDRERDAAKVRLKKLLKEYAGTEGPYEISTRFIWSDTGRPRKVTGIEVLISLDNGLSDAEDRLVEILKVIPTK